MVEFSAEVSVSVVVGARYLAHTDIPMELYFP